MKKLKVLFALNQDLNRSLETKLLNEYKKEYGHSFEFDKAINLDEIKTKIKDFDLLILNEELEINNSISLEEIEIIKKMSTSTRIILIVSSENKNDEFIEKVNKLGVYDLMFSEEISIENIIFLIENPKEKSNDEISLEEKEIKTEEVKIQTKIYKIKNINNKKSIPNEKITKSVVIGIGGVNNSSGVTHTTLAIASYLKRTGNKIAIIEFNTKPRLGNLLIEADSDNDKYFTLNQLDIYYQRHSDQGIHYFNDVFSEVKSKDYQYIIIDFGTLKEINDEGIVKPNSSYKSMARTDYQILCLNGSSWKWSDINFYRCDDFAEVEPNISSWILSINLVTENKFKAIKKEVENISVIKKIKKSPIYLNPFTIDENNIRYLEGLLEDLTVIENSNKNNVLLKLFENKLN